MARFLTDLFVSSLLITCPVLPRDNVFIILDQSAFAAKIPDAYEDLLLDVIRGDKHEFIGFDELAAAWDVFTPVLHEIDERQIKPEPYPFGSPEESVARSFKARYGID